MLKNIKAVSYAVLLGCAIWFGYGFYNSYSKSTQPPPQNTSTNQPPEVVTAPETRHTGTMMAYLGGLLVVFVGLGIMGAYDLSRLVANRVEKFVFNDDLTGVHDPEYDQAEQVWAHGKHLEAIQLMRDYLTKHPMEQYVALRIAEIYEKDLNNHIAAALEYEEVLKKRLPPDRWGWSAIHLSNLYSGKLNKIPEATALLHRIVEEYGQTPAAKKARERLGIPEPVVEAPPAPEPPPEAPAAEPPPSNLPPGFRPK